MPKREHSLPVGICIFNDQMKPLFKTALFDSILNGLRVERKGSPLLAEELLSFAASKKSSHESSILYQTKNLDGLPRVILCHLFPMGKSFGPSGSMLVHIQDMTDIETQSRETDSISRYQEVLGKIAHLSVSGASLKDVADFTSRETARALDVDFCKILIPGDSDPLLHLLAGVGWQEGLVGSYVQEGGIHSQAGFSIREKKPVIVRDMHTEKRFSPSNLLSSHQVRSGVSVPMMFQGQVLGAMSIHTVKVRAFDSKEIDFLETVANTFATILDRWKREETQLSLYKRLFAQVQDGVILTDKNGIILEWNPAMERMSGWLREETIGKTPALLSSGRQGPDFYNLLWQTLRSGKSFTGRFINRQKDQTEFLVWENISPVMDPDNSIRYFLSILTDLSEREKLLEALRQTEQIKLVGQLSGGLIHEIRNPLIGMGSLADHIGASRKLPEELRRQVQLIAGEARRIDELLESHLSVMRPKSFDFQHLDLLDLVEDAHSLLAQAFRKAKIKFSLTCESSISSIEGARGPLQQVFLNLMMNAVDAMPDGGTISVKIEVVPHQSRNGIRITIQDSGKGIPDHIIKRMHEPFFTYGKAKGVGLGLSITRDIVDRHRGQVSIESSAGQGVLATVWLPLKQEDK
jgi:PAS domain S-box-containing protein